MFNTNLILILW